MNNYKRVWPAILVALALVVVFGLIMPLLSTITGPQAAIAAALVLFSSIFGVMMVRIALGDEW